MIEEWAEQDLPDSAGEPGVIQWLSPLQEEFYTWSSRAAGSAEA